MADEAPTLGKPHTQTSEALSTPHDRVGKAVTVGSQVAIAGGGRGIVKSVSDDTAIVVEREDGTDATVASGDLIVLVEAADMEAPPDPAADPEEGAPPAEPVAGPAAQPAPPVDPDTAPDVPGAGVQPGTVGDTTPAPDADPEGAFAWLVDDEGVQQAWLRNDEAPDPVGYVQTNIDDPNSIVRYADATAWAADVDAMDLHSADENPSPMQPAGPGDAAPDEPVEDDTPPAIATDDEDVADGEDEDEDDDDEEDEEDNDKTPPQFRKRQGKGIEPGVFVTWGADQVGQVDIVVTSGTVPGVAGDSAVAGTKDAPVARVTVWHDGVPTGEKAAVETSTLAPLDGVSSTSVKSVRDRGVNAWPGASVTALTADEWATGRVNAFFTKALGGEVPGYVGDDDLLTAPPHAEITATPDAPAAEAKAAPDAVNMVTIDKATIDATLAQLTEWAAADHTPRR